MELSKFFSLLATCLGLGGSIFLAKGIVGLSPNGMLRLTSPYSRLAYAPEQIDSMAGQKADALVGVVIIFLAFLIQGGALVFVEDGTVLFKAGWTGVCIALVATLILMVIFSFVDKIFQNHTKLAIGKIAIRDYCADRFNGMIDPVNAKSLETMSQQLLNMSRETAETKVDFIKRIAKYVDWKISKETDFSRITENNNDR
jgi:hypothetical protein